MRVRSAIQPTFYSDTRAKTPPISATTFVRYFPSVAKVMLEMWLTKFVLSDWTLAKDVPLYPPYPDHVVVTLPEDLTERST